MNTLVVTSTAPITVIFPFSAAVFTEVSLSPIIFDLAIPTLEPIGLPCQLVAL